MNIINENYSTINSRIVKIILVAAFMVNGVSVASQTAGRISISVDPIVEVVSTVCRLAGYEEYNMGSFPNYFKIAGAYFKPYENHRAVQLARKLRESHSIAYNAPMGLATYLMDVESMEPKIPLSPIPEDLDKRWDTDAAMEFIAALKEFWNDTEFQSFMDNNQNLYNTAISRFQILMEKHDLMNFFEAYFGLPQRNKFSIILGLQNGGANYASMVTDKKGNKEVYAIIGCWSQDNDGMPLFPDDIIATVVHEFCHSYTNPLVDQYQDDLGEPAKEIFLNVQDEMTAMAYPSWELMLNESFVRATVIRYLTIEMGLEAATKRAERDDLVGFKWVDDLAEFMINYENSREQFPSFDHFVPKIAEFFDENIDKLQKEIKENKNKIDWEAMKTEGPQILEISPGNGSENVDPELKEIRIKFDREMGPGMALMKVYFENYPELTGNPGFEEDNTIFVIPVKLKPEWNYYLELNNYKKYFFQDKEGRPLHPYALKFSTGKSRQ